MQLHIKDDAGFKHESITFTVVILSQDKKSIDYYINAIMLRSSRKVYSFCTAKYFRDASFKNATVIAYDTPGGLSRLCSVFANYGVDLTYLRTHYETRTAGDQNELRIEFSLKSKCQQKFEMVKRDLSMMGITLNEAPTIKVPWFPRKLSDLDMTGQILFNIRPQQLEQNKDHPHFVDPQYIQRRKQIAKIGLNYKMGQDIPDVYYSPEEHQLWRKICKKVDPLQRQAMTQKFIAQKKELEKQVKLSERIPQMNELSVYLQKKSGFRMKPVSGMISQRQFLNALAFKVFCSSQYIRHPSCVDYTPQPDIVHEYLGHVGSLADPNIAKFSQTLGLLSLGASDEEVTKLGALYLFTLEFGACKENGKIKCYGAGIAGSVSELEYFLGRAQQKPRFQTLDIFRDCNEKFPTTTVQPVYKVTNTFEEALSQLERYGRSIIKPITTVYDEKKNRVIYDRNIEGVFVPEEKSQV